MYRLYRNCSGLLIERLMELSADLPIISGIKDHDLTKSLTQELTRTILTEPEYRLVPTLLADMAVTVTGKIEMILASPKEGKDKALDAEKRRLIKC